MVRKMVPAGFAAAIGAASLLAAGAASAVTFDAFSSFDGTQGAGGFTYGSYNGSTQVLTPFSANTTTGCTGFISQTICLDDNGNLPGVFKTTAGAHQSGTVLVPADALILHPGPVAGEDSAVEFTIQTTGRYAISLSTFVADTNPSGVIIYGLLNGAETQLATLNSANPTFADSGTVLLTAGDIVGIAVDYDGLYNNDSTGVDFSLSPVPEPATWGLMLLGVGGLGAALRSRPRFAVNRV